MSNKPANRPGHPIHGFNRRFPRSAKRRRTLEIQWNTMRNHVRKLQNEIRWSEGVKPTEQPTNAEKLFGQTGVLVGEPLATQLLDELAEEEMAVASS